MAETRDRAPSGTGSGGGGSSSAASRRSRVRSWLPSSSSYAAAEAVTLAALVTYDVLGSTDAKMPRPGPIVATLGFFAALAAVGSISRTFEPVVVAAGWVLALSVLVTGNRGKGILALFSKLAGFVQNVGSSPAVG